MTTLSQIQHSDEVWSLEEDDGALYLHHVADDLAPRTVMPVTRAVLEMLVARFGEAEMCIPDDLDDTARDEIWEQAETDAIHGHNNSERYPAGPEREFYIFSLRQCWHKENH
jgi:hypothetical protein